MSRPPPRSTRTDTLVPYTTLCRSNAEIEGSKRDDVLKVANAVLRYKPSDDAAGGPAPRTRGGGGMVDDLTRTAASLKLDANQQAAFDSARSEAHTSELPSLMRISYAVFCLKQQKHPPYSYDGHQSHTHHTCDTHDNHIHSPQSS